MCYNYHGHSFARKLLHQFQYFTYHLWIKC